MYKLGIKRLVRTKMKYVLTQVRTNRVLRIYIFVSLLSITTPSTLPILKSILLISGVSSYGTLGAPFGIFKNHYQREYWQKEANEYPYNPYLNNGVSWNIVFPVLDKDIVASTLIYIYIGMSYTTRLTYSSLLELHTVRYILG